jgi:hypothetical protein
MLAAVRVPRLLCNPVKLILVNISINAQLIKQRLSIETQAGKHADSTFPAFGFQALTSGILIALFPETTQPE